MRVNACGKDCAVCGEYLTESCTGCGAETAEFCSIARCAEKKCFDKCAECWKNDDCKKLLQKGNMPTLRKDHLHHVAERRRWAQQSRKPLRLWLTILAVLAVLRAVGSVLSAGVSDWIVVLDDMLGENDRLIAAACLVAYGVVLLVLSRLQEKYRRAGFCIVLSGVLTAIQPYWGEGKILPLAVSLFSLLLSFVGEYYECTAHADTVLGTDGALAEKWSRVWKWVIGGQAALVISFPLLPYALPLAALMLLGSVFVLARIYLRKVLWLLQTAQSL